MSDNRADELVAFGLGSCVGVAMTDSHAGVAGLAHVMLPASGARDVAAGKFADTAVPALLARVLELGGARTRLRVAIAGGASMFGPGGPLDIGARNVEAVHAALTKAGLRCVAADTGGEAGRTMRVCVDTGAATIRAVGGVQDELLAPAPTTTTVRRAA